MKRVSETKGILRGSIKIKLTLGFALVLTIVFSISIIAYSSLKQAQRGTQRIQAEYNKLIDVTKIYTMFLEFEYSFDRFRAQRDLKSEQAEDMALKANYFVEMCLTYLKHPKNNLELGYLQYLIGVARTLFERFKNWDWSKISVPEDLERSEENLEEIKKMVNLLQKETKAKERITDLEERSKRHALRFLISGVVLSLGAACLFVYLFSRLVYNPLISLHQGAKHISRGNLGYQLEIPSNDEIGELAQEFNHMSTQLKKSYADLEAQLERRSEKLKEIENQLSRAERLASVGRLAAGVAHEINNPLTLIAACTDGLLNRTRSPQLNAIEAFQPFPEYLKKIDEEVYRCKKITAGLLNFSKERPSEMKEVDIHEFLSDTITLLNQEALKQKKRLKLEGQSQDLIHLDPFMLKQILINLVINALEASPIDSEVTVRYTLSKEELQIEVEDEGSGIDPTIIGKIFDPFFTTKEAGIGLGLAICYGLAKKHGGFISAVSKGKGKGSQFLFQLPFSHQNQPSLKN